MESLPTVATIPDTLQENATERPPADSNLLSRDQVLAGTFMRTVAEYRIHADKCRELANLIPTPTEKKILEEIARSWEKLADLRKRDREPEGNGQLTRPQAVHATASNVAPPIRSSATWP